MSRRRSLFEDEIQDDVESILSETVEILTNAERRQLSDDSAHEDDEARESVRSDSSQGLVTRRRSFFEESDNESN